MVHGTKSRSTGALSIDHRTLLRQVLACGAGATILSKLTGCVRPQVGPGPSAVAPAFWGSEDLDPATTPGVPARMQVFYLPPPGANLPADLVPPSLRPPGVVAHPDLAAFQIEVLTSFDALGGAPSDECSVTLDWDTPAGSGSGPVPW